MTRLLHAALIAACLSVPATAPALGQQADIRFGGLTQDTSLPVEVDADSLSVDQAAGTAVFQGNVLVKQGEMRLTAGQVRVEYDSSGNAIARLHATGGVTLVSPQDAAEAQEAIYTIDTGTVEMIGSVLLTQGNAAISGERLTVNLKTGSGTMTGRVKTIFTPGGTTP